MKTLLSVIASIGICSSASAQISQFFGELKPINNSFVSGSFSGTFDQKTSIVSILGTASAQASAVDVKPIKDVKVSLAPNSGLIYNVSSSSFSAVNITKTSESISETSFDVYGLKVFISLKNEVFSFNSSFKASPTNDYTFILNSGSQPVAYGSFVPRPVPTPVPEPMRFAAASGLGLIGFSLFRRNRSEKVYKDVKDIKVF